MFHSLGMTPTASTRLGATLFPADVQSRRYSQIPILPTPVSQPPSASATPAPHPWDPPEEIVIDPVDKAMARLVNELNFAAADAKRALANTDTGFGMDVDRAIQMLNAEAEGKAGRQNGKTLSNGHTNTGTVRRRTDTTGLCENCGCTNSKRRHLPRQPSDHTSTSLDERLSTPASSTDLDREAVDTLGQLFLQSCQPTNPKAISRRSSTAKAYKVLGVDVARSPSGKKTPTKPKVGRFGSMRLKPSTSASLPGQNQIQLLKTLSRGVGTVKMPRVNLGMGIGLNMNLATLGLGRENKEQTLAQVAERGDADGASVKDGSSGENKNAKMRGIPGMRFAREPEQGVYAGLM